MHGGDYYMLMASLPALPRRFDAGPAPITLQRLRSRWGLLSEEDRAILERIADSLLWDRQPLERTGEEVIRAYEALVRDLSQPVVREVIAARMEIRVVVGALRRRRLGQGPPEGGPWAGVIRRNWARPDLGLAAALPWVTEVARLLDHGDTLETERAILGVAWRRLEEASERVNYFSFESLVIYLARRDVVMRWANLDAGRGKERFDQLVTEALGEHA
jgi:hypothetical protein